jgi:predicted nucleotidyltransferase
MVTLQNNVPFYQPLHELIKIIGHLFTLDRVILFGSVARHEADAESDIDLLIITQIPLKRTQRHQITDATCEINLKYGTNFSTLVVDKENWHHGFISFLPIHTEIEREGIIVNK